MNVECATMQRLIVKDESGQKNCELLDSPVVIGRAPEVKMMISDKESSRRHCQLEKVEFGWKVVDLESRNGTRVNGKFVNQHLLRPGDVISIGKTTMTYEDPNWQPPAQDDLMKYAAAAQPVAQPSPASPEPRIDTAVEPAIQPPPPERPRSGHTTAVGKRSRVDAAESRSEASTLKIVGVLVAIFVLVVVGLIAAGAVTSESPGVSAGRAKLEQAKKLSETDLRAAIILLSEVRPDAGRYFRDATELMERYKAKSAEPVTTSSPEEEEAIKKISDLVDEANGRTSYADRIIKASQEFKTKYPRSKFMPQADEFLVRAQGDKTAMKGNTLDDMEREVAALLKTNDYAAAWKSADAVYGKFKTDLDVRPKIEKLMLDIVEAGRKYCTEEITAARILQKTQPQIAREKLTDVITKLGDGKVDAFSTQCKTAVAYLEQMKQ